MENVRPGAYIPEEHLKDMDLDGIDVDVLYPTQGLFLYSVPDSELLTSLCRAYNDWLAEFCHAFPHRLKGIAMLNIDDVSAGVRELERCAKLGLAGALITVYPLEEHSYASAEYEPLWAASQDLALPLSLHIATNRPGPNAPLVDLEAVPTAFLVNVDHWVRMSLSNMIFSGVFERYPKLQVGSVEQELSWAPHFLERLDYNYTQRPPTGGRPKFKDAMLPSDFFHRNVFLSFQEDALGIRDRHIIGLDNIMWGSDYPHPECTFPVRGRFWRRYWPSVRRKRRPRLLGEMRPGSIIRIEEVDYGSGLDRKNGYPRTLRPLRARDRRPQARSLGDVL